MEEESVIKAAATKKESSEEESSAASDSEDEESSSEEELTDAQRMEKEKQELLAQLNNVPIDDLLKQYQNDLDNMTKEAPTKNSVFRDLKKDNNSDNEDD